MAKMGICALCGRPFVRTINAMKYHAMCRGRAYRIKREDNRGRRLEWQRNYYQAHKEEETKRRRRYYKANRESVLAKVNAYGRAKREALRGTK